MEEPVGFWDGVVQFLRDWPIVQALIVVGVAFVVRWVLQFVIRRTVAQIVSGVKKGQGTSDTQAIVNSPLAAVRVVQRTRTMGTVLGNVVTWIIVVVAFILVLGVFKVDLGPIVGSAAVATAALGFGAQNIIKDILQGLFMVFEDQLGVGDVVDLGPATGVVEEVGIRITKVRDVNGTLWFVRNGEILRVGNMSQGWARVIIDLAVPYDTDVQEVQGLILATAKTLAADPKWAARILETPELWGLESISAEAMVIRLVAKTRTSTKDDVARELRVRLKAALDEAGIKLPQLGSIVLSGFEGAASVRGAQPPRTKPVPVTNKPPRAPRKPKGGAS
ncbi:MAG: mechanosensitive ion channel family protein [Microbacteriaceae bacterium]